MIPANETAYVGKRGISESGRLISEIIEVFEKNWRVFRHHGVMGYAVSFDSLDNDFLVTVLNKFGFGKKFIELNCY